MSRHLSSAQLRAYVDGEGAASARAEIAAHLESCPQCWAEHAVLQQVEQALTLLGTSEPAPDLLLDLRHRLAAPPSRSWRWAWGAAAAAAAVTGIVLLWPRPAPPRTGVTLASTGSTHPKATVVVPREVKQPVLVEVKAPVRQARPEPAVHHPRVAPRRRTRVVLVRSNQSAQRPHLATARPEPVVAKRELFAATRAEAQAAAAGKAVQEPAPAQGGIILILGDPQPVPASNECHLEVSRPDGTRSVFTQTQSRDRSGQVRTARVSLQNYAAGER